MDKKSKKFSRLQLRSTQSNNRVKNKEVISHYFQSKTKNSKSFSEKETDIQTVDISQDDECVSNSSTDISQLDKCSSDGNVNKNVRKSRAKSDSNIESVKLSIENIHYSDDDSAFKTPKPVRRISTDLIPKSRNKSGSNETKKKGKSNRGRKKIDRSQTDIRKNFLPPQKKTDVNEEHMNLAVALSLSMNDQYSQEKSFINESQSSFQETIDVYPSTQEKILRTRKTLEEFGFKCNKTNTHVENFKIPTVQKIKRKLTKFGNITPALLRRTSIERQEKIAEKVSSILDENIEEINTSNFYCDSVKNVNSFYLENYFCPENILFTKASLNPTDASSFYIKDFISEFRTKVGSLLKKWSDIPGRDLTPPRVIKPDVSQDGNIESVSSDYPSNIVIENFSSNEFTKSVAEVSPKIISPYRRQSQNRENDVKTEHIEITSESVKSICQHDPKLKIQKKILNNDAMSHSKLLVPERIFLMKSKSELHIEKNVHQSRNDKSDDEKRKSCRKSLSFDFGRETENDKSSLSFLDNLKSFSYQKSDKKLDDSAMDCQRTNLNEMFKGSRQCVSPDLFSDSDDNNEMSAVISETLTSLFTGPVINATEKLMTKAILSENKTVEGASEGQTELNVSTKQTNEVNCTKDDLKCEKIDSENKCYDLTQSSDQSDEVIEIFDNQIDSEHSVEFSYSDKSHNSSFYANVKDSDSGNDSFDLPEVFKKKVKSKRSSSESGSDKSTGRIKMQNNHNKLSQNIKNNEIGNINQLNSTQSDSESDVCIINDDELNYSCSTPYNKKCISLRRKTSPNVKIKLIDKKIDHSESDKNSSSSFSSDKTVSLNNELKCGSDLTPKLVRSQLLQGDRSISNSLLSDSKTIHNENEPVENEIDLNYEPIDPILFDNFHMEMNHTYNNTLPLPDVSEKKESSGHSKAFVQNLKHSSPKKDQRPFKSESNKEFADQWKYITPKKEILIKTDSVTPMANYDAMNTPQLKGELQKFGLKPLKRTRGTQILKYIYNATHPINEDLKLVDSSDSEEECLAPKRRKKNNANNTNSPIKSSQIESTVDPSYNFACSDFNKIKIVGNLLSENHSVNDLIFERKQSKKISSCRLPLHIAWHNFIASRPDIHIKILKYQPIQLESLHKDLKALGFKYNIQDLLTFLDRKCITVRTYQNAQRNKRPALAKHSSQQNKKMNS